MPPSTCCHRSPIICIAVVTCLSTKFRMRDCTGGGGSSTLPLSFNFPSVSISLFPHCSSSFFVYSPLGTAEFCELFILSLVYRDCCWNVFRIAWPEAINSSKVEPKLGLYIRQLCGASCFCSGLCLISYMYYCTSHRYKISPVSTTAQTGSWPQPCIAMHITSSPIATLLSSI